MQGYLTAAIALLVGYEGWLNPAARHNAYYIANDSYDELAQRIRWLDPTDKEGIVRAQADYQAINRQLQKNTLL